MRSLIICILILDGLHLQASTGFLVVPATLDFLPLVPPASGFGPLDGFSSRTTHSNFNNLIPLNAQIQIADLQALATAEDTLNTALTSLQSTVSNYVTAAVTKCPATAPAGSLVVGSYCYYVNNVAETFSNAQAYCFSKGGTLAQPTRTNSASFYSAIAAAFPVQIAAITGLEVWIGLFQKTATPPTTPFTYLTNNVQVAVTTTNFNAIPTASTNMNGAVLGFPGTGPWKYYDITTGAVTRPYICQFITYM